MQDSNIPLTVPEVLREAGFVPRKKGTKRPAPVPESWFADVGLPVPDDPGQCNACQLTGREGFAWSPELDARVATHGAELRGHGALVLVDCDAERLVDGSPGIDGMRRLADLVTEGGGILDLSGAVRVRTPGNGDHGPGVHLWWRADPGYPVQYGTLNRCKLVEFLHRGTAPGSPGYPVQYVPRKLAVIPRRVAKLAGPPREQQAPAGSSGGGSVYNRLAGIIDRLLQADHGERNRLLYWSAARLGEMVASGRLDAGKARRVLSDAAAEIGLRPAEARDTIASGLSAGGAR